MVAPDSQQYVPANAREVRDVGSILVLGRSPGGGSGNPLQYSCLKNSMDRGVWWATVHGVTKTWTPLSKHRHGIPLHTCTPSSLSIPLLMDIQVASMSWLL